MFLQLHNDSISRMYQNYFHCFSMYEAEKGIQISISVPHTTLSLLFLIISLFLLIPSHTQISTSSQRVCVFVYRLEILENPQKLSTYTPPLLR